jgi:hypothetical protein
MGYYDQEFSTAQMKENSPFSNLVMVNGLIVDRRSLSPEIQDFLGRKEK